MHVAVRSFLDELRALGRSPLTVSAYEGDLRQFTTYLAGRAGDLLSASDRDVRAYRRELIERGYRPATVNRRLNALRSFYKWAEAEDLVQRAPTRGLVLAKVREETPSSVTDQDVERMLSAARGDQAAFAALALLAFTGLRRSEAASLTWKDVDLRQQLIWARRKGGRLDPVPLVQPLLGILETLRERAFVEDGDPVLLGRFGRPLGRGGLARVVRQYARAAGIEQRVTPHSFRHGVATRLAERGVDAFTVAAILGHRDIATTQRYVHPSWEAKRRGLSSLAPEPMAEAAPTTEIASDAPTDELLAMLIEIVAEQGDIREALFSDMRKQLSEVRRRRQYLPHELRSGPSGRR